jgi:FkbM family methyltransferase
MFIKFTNKIVSQSKIYYLDIGARWGISWPWSAIQSDKLEVFLVEPDPEEAALLQKQGHGKVLPYALWNKETELTLNINNLPATSSVLKPNIKFLNQFPDSQRFESNETVNLKTKTIDGLASEGELKSIDFVKIDVQGGEYAILKGGEDFFKNNIVGLEVEVEFAEMYQNQPLFSDVDIFVREKLGLELWDIRKVYWKYKQNKYQAPLKGRLIFGDALYLRPALSLDSWLSEMDKDTASSKMKALITSAIAYGYLDYASTLLSKDYSDKYISKETKEQYIQQVKKISKGFYPFKNGNKLIYRVLSVLMKIFEPSYKGFGTADSNLGSKKRLFFWN